MDRSKRLGEASIPFLLATFSAPAIVGMLAQAIYNVVDRVFIGHALGPDGIAGITVSLPLFIFRFGWGMRGAGLATVLSQAVSATWTLLHFVSGRSVLRLHIGSLRVSWPVCASIMAIGSPPFLMQLAASVMNSLLNNQLRTHGGDLAISVMGVIYAVAMMIFMPILPPNDRYFCNAKGPIRLVPTANSSIHNFWACGRRPGPKYGAIKNWLNFIPGKSVDRNTTSV